MSKLLEYRFDLHVHTRCSFDSITSPEQLVKAAVRRGLAGLAVTDHDSVKCIAHVKREAGEDLTVIPGIECKTRQGDLIGLFVSERPLGSSILEVADQVKQMDGLVVLPHPISYFRKSVQSYQEMEVIRKVDAIETFNARNVFGRLNQKAERLAAKFNKTRVGGSDAHTQRGWMRVHRLRLQRRG